jgi:hypothetical protein
VKWSFFWDMTCLLPAAAGCLLGLIFNPEDGGNISLQNVSCLSTDFTALYVYLKDRALSYKDDSIKNGEGGWACRTHREGTVSVHNFNQKT